jgi:hypothetical protein
MVDLMVNAHRTAEGKHMFTSRRLRVATLIAAVVLGFGGMAAASPSFGSESPVEPMNLQQEQPTDVVEDEQLEAVEEEKLEEDENVETDPVFEPLAGDPDPDTQFHEGYCEDGNHGKTVSAVARGVFDPGGEYPEGVHVTVKMAAQSSCGKAGGVDGDDVETDEEIETAEAPAVEAERPGRNANANANGNGNGKRGG